MNQLLIWTFGVTIGAVGIAASNEEFTSVGFGIALLLLIVLILKRQRKNEGKELR